MPVLIISKFDRFPIENKVALHMTTFPYCIFGENFICLQGQGTPKWLFRSAKTWAHLRINAFPDYLQVRIIAIKS